MIARLEQLHCGQGAPPVFQPAIREPSTEAARARETHGRGTRQTSSDRRSGQERHSLYTKRYKKNQQRALFTAAFFQDSAEPQSAVARIARFRSPGAYRKALQPYLDGDTPVLEDLGVGRVRFRNHYLRLWCLLQHSRAINLLPVLRDPAYYRELLPSEVRLMLPP